MKTGWRISKEGRYTYYCETDGRIVLGTPNENEDQFQPLNGIQEYVVPAKLDSLTVRKVEGLHVPSCKLLRFEEGIEWIGLWGGRNTVFTKVVIPSSVKVIDTYCFSGSPELEQIDIDCEYVGSYAFSGCKNLKNIHFGENVKEIAAGAFYNCPALERVTLPKSLECLGYPDGSDREVFDPVFALCTGLKEVFVPKELNDICKEPFPFGMCNAQIRMI